MVILRWFAVVLLAFASTARSDENLYGPESVFIKDAAPDSTGRIWAIPGASPSRLVVRSETGWKAAPIPAEKLGEPQFICPHPNGSVLVLWDDGRDCAVTEHTGDTARLRCRLGSRIENFRAVTIFVDSRANVWITQPLGTIHRITPEGDARQIHQVPLEKFINPEPRRAESPLLAAEDNRGRIWFWSNSTGRDTVMPGLLLWDGRNFTHHERFPGLPANIQISALLCKDDRHLWLAWLTTKRDSGAMTFERGLVECDSDTLQCKALPEPARKGIEGVERLLKDGDDIYALVYQWAGPGALWRLRGGKWGALDSNLEADHYMSRRWERPCHLTTHGIIVSDGTRMQFVPKSGGVPVNLDWRTTIRGYGAKHFFAMSGGDYLLVTHHGHAVRGPLEIPPKSADSPRMTLVRSGELPSLVKGKPGWEAVARANPDSNAPKGGIMLPPEFANKSVRCLCLDNEGTLWFLADREPYKFRDGRAAAVLGSGERHPFLDGRSLLGVGVDDSGAAILRTSRKDEFVVIRPSTVRPRSKVQVKEIAGDKAVLQFSNLEPGGGTFAWRLDGGDWKIAQEAVTLEPLVNGEHIVEVLCTNDEHLREVAPVKAQWTIFVDYEALVRAAIIHLKSGTAAQREAAVVSLAKSPQLALVPLKAAREGASEDQLWWIEAATQEVERISARKSAAPQP